MSKGNMLLGHARGKVGDLVFSRSNGQQVVRARAAVVKNPKTEAQTIQRTILNTVAQAYSKMQPIVDHSFEGIPEGQKTMSAFMRANLDAVRAKIAQAVANNWDYDSIYAFVPIGTNKFAPNDFIVSRGSLPSVVVAIPSANTTTAELGGTTYGDIISALGLKRGDQLTFLNIKATRSLDSQDSTFEYARVILDPQNADGSAADLSTPLLADGAINLPSPRNTGQLTDLAIAQDGTLTFNIAGNQRITLAAAVIVSRQNTTGEWQRSTTQLVTNDDNIGGFVNSLQYALDYAEQNSLASLSDLYLNNAGTGSLPNSGEGLNIELVVGSAPTESTTANIVKVGYKTYSGTGDVLMAYEADNTEHVLVVGNSDSVFLGKALLKAAASINSGDENAAFANAPSGTERAWANNDILLWLNNKGYITTYVIGTTGILQN